MGLQSETALATEPVAVAETGVSSTLILGADDSEGARDAAALAQVLAPLLGAEVVPVHASGRGSPARQLYEEASARHAEIVVLDDAAYITGQTLFVDGGLTLYPSFLTPGPRNEYRARGRRDRRESKRR